MSSESVCSFALGNSFVASWASVEPSRAVIVSKEEFQALIEAGTFEFVGTARISA